MRVLIVEDEVDLTDALKRALGEAGLVCDVAHDGETGLFNARSWDYDAIVLDLMLPGLDGETILRRLREEKRTPVLVLTARDTLSDKVLGLKSGADDYIVKPFEYLELSARLTAIFSRLDRTMVKERQSVHHVEINHKTREVIIRDQPVKLTKTEFQLLQLFISHPGQTLSREFIEKQIWWDAKLYSNSRALDVHIQRLRKKIEARPETPELIITITGVGYKFNPEKE